MGYTSPAAQSSGAVAPVSWATAVKAGLDYFSNVPMCRVYQTGAQSIPNTTETALQFAGERFDTDTMHDNATNNTRITVVTAGVYLFWGQILWGAATSGVREAFLRLNGSGVYLGLQNQTTPNSAYQNVSGLWKCVAGDYVELRANQTSGGALSTLVSGTFVSEFGALWVGLG